MCGFFRSRGFQGGESYGFDAHYATCAVAVVETGVVDADVGIINTSMRFLNVLLRILKIMACLAAQEVYEAGDLYMSIIM
jgi:hypothetical protein